MYTAFRRSKKFGFLRFTLSNSRICASVGDKHVRLTKSMRGTFLSAGADGFRVRQRIDDKDTSASHDAKL
jgi:hypothetical protein